MQDSYLNRLLINIYRYWSISWFDLSVMVYSFIYSSKLWLIPWHSVLNCKFRFYHWIPRFCPCFLHRGNHRAVRVKNRVNRVLGTTRYFTKPGNVTFSFFLVGYRLWSFDNTRCNTVYHMYSCNSLNTHHYSSHWMHSVWYTDRVSSLYCVRSGVPLGLNKEG